MKQQLEQLLKDAEEVTAKMREVLASMDKPAINMEHGKWYRVQATWNWLIKFNKFEGKSVFALDTVPLNVVTEGRPGYFCDVNNIKSCTPATPEDMQLLPDGHPEKPKPALAATYDEIADVVKPKWAFKSFEGTPVSFDEQDPYQLPTESAAKQTAAFSQIKNLEAYCAVKFDGDRNNIIDVDAEGGLFPVECDYGIIKVTREAANWLIANHPEPFLVFFGVKS